MRKGWRLELHTADELSEALGSAVVKAESLPHS
jgi:hypothetical protein